MKLISYQEKLTEKSHGKLLAINYHGSKEKLSVGCSECGNVWKIRADHLLDRPYCPKCKKKWWTVWPLGTKCAKLATSCFWTKWPEVYQIKKERFSPIQKSLF